MTRTGHNRWLGLVTIEAWAQLVSVNRNPKKQKDEWWWRVKIYISVSKPPCLSALHANRWRVKGFFMISFFKNWFYQNAYLWHKCAPRGAHLCSLRNNFTAKESNMTNWAFAVLKNYRKLETTAFVKYLMFNFKFTKAVVLTNWAHLKKSFLIISSYVTIW